MTRTMLPTRFKLALGLLALLIGCTTITAPLEDGVASDEEPEAGYIVGITHLRYTEETEEDFNHYVEMLQELIQEAPGNVGVSYRANVLTRDRWTLSIWTDRASMARFVASPEHLEAIREVMPGAEVARTARYEIAVDQYPPNWDDALETLRLEGIDR